MRRLDTSVEFYRTTLGLGLVYTVPDRRAAFFWLGGAGRSILGLWEVTDAPNAMSLHPAFTSTVEDVLAAPAKLRAAGVAPLGFDGESVDEPVVIA